MERNIVMINNDSIIFNGFKKLDNAQKINIMILGYKKVIILERVPEILLTCHNIVEIKNKTCNDKHVIKKLFDAGLAEECVFLETNDSYIFNISSK